MVPVRSDLSLSSESELRLRSLLTATMTPWRPRPLPVVCTCSNRARTCKVPRAYFPGSTGTVWVMVTFSGTGFVVRMRRPLPFLPYSGAQSTRVPEGTG